MEVAEAQHKWAVEKLRKSERHFESLLSDMHEDIMVIDQDYRIAHVNKGLLATIGSVFFGLYFARLVVAQPSLRISENNAY
ncbi:MAG: hypothetical protein JSU72_18410 [Deltaproteobacteria bacterium]|nr:MAG: hypothetical protein JSU72_18410 [Deltaproteobacteria bacterium]